MFHDKFIDSKAVIGCLWEGMLRRHSIINRKDWDIQWISPYPCIILHGSTRKSDKSSTVKVEDSLLYGGITIIWRSIAPNCFLFWIFPYVLVCKQSDCDSVGSFLEDIHIRVEDSISRHEHLYIMFDSFVCELRNLFYCSIFRNVPHLLCDFDGWMPVEDEAS